MEEWTAIRVALPRNCRSNHLPVKITRYITWRGQPVDTGSKWRNANVATNPGNCTWKWSTVRSGMRRNPLHEPCRNTNYTTENRQPVLRVNSPNHNHYEMKVISPMDMLLCLGLLELFNHHLRNPTWRVFQTASLITVPGPNWADVLGRGVCRPSPWYRLI